MKNVLLSATRTISQNYDKSSENEENYYLDVNLVIKDKTKVDGYVFVSIFSTDLYLISRVCAEQTSDKSFCATMKSKTQWTAGKYYIYVYHNGVSKWFGSLNLECDGNTTSQAWLKSIYRHPQEKFFADNLWSCYWWKMLKGGKFKEPLIRTFIERMLFFTNQVKERKIKKIPNMIVVGDKLAAKTFASMILGGFMSYDDEYEGKYCFALSEVTTGACGWTSQEYNFINSRVVVIDISDVKYSTSTINIVNMLISIIRQDAYKDITFVLHGTEEAFTLISDNCPSANELFTDMTTFRITHNRSIDFTSLDDDEFNKLFDDYSSDNYTSSDYYEDNSENEEDSLINELADRENMLYNPNTNKAEFILNEMIGLKKFKKDLEEAKIMSLFAKKREELALNTDEDKRNHMLFLGNPGTGKTTVAKLVGQIYHDMGLLSKGHTIETNRSKLMGEYIGQTEKKILETIEEARGGILFIDEAYNIVSSEEDKKDYGKEIINALLPVLSEPDPDMIVIFAGYEDKMKDMMKINPGLKDRFPLCFHFDDYSETELMEIARMSLEKMNYILTPDADARLFSIIKNTIERKDKFFGNGRWIHNLIKHGIIKSMAMRVMSSSANSILDEKVLCTIEECDIIEAERDFLGCKQISISSSRPIGFRA